jgi:hypothetical protein
MISFSIFLGIIAYCLLKWYRTKRESLLFVIAIACFLEIVRAPFKLPIELSLSLCGFFGFGVLLYKVLAKKVEKSFYIFSILFLMFGLVFLLQAIQEMGYEDRIFRLVARL